MSHHEQRKSQAVSRTKTQRRPAYVDSPWMEWKISLTVNIGRSPRPSAYNCTVSLRIGTSGWSYPSGKGTWNGVFYPPRKGRSSALPGFDELTWYAEHFDTVEVNSSFYGPPTPETTSKWAERTPAGFEFCLKLHQQFTHPEMYKKAALADLPDQSADVLAALARVTAADVGRFKDGLEPLAVRGRLGALLAQFPAQLSRHAGQP